MDVAKIGKFLAKLRHEKNFTQEQLGELIGVSNKTISRWENGNYMPPVEQLQQLSKLYEISINEILSGERLDEQEYKEHAEENIKTVLSVSAFSLDDRITFFQKKWKKEQAFSLTIEMLLFLSVLITGIVLDNGLWIAVVICSLIWSIKKYNEMMAYVERYAYDGSTKGR